MSPLNHQNKARQPQGPGGGENVAQALVEDLMNDVNRSLNQSPTGLMAVSPVENTLYSVSSLREESPRNLLTEEVEELVNLGDLPNVEGAGKGQSPGK